MNQVLSIIIQILFFKNVKLLKEVIEYVEHKNKKYFFTYFNKYINK